MIDMEAEPVAVNASPVSVVVAEIVVEPVAEISLVNVQVTVDVSVAERARVSVA